MATTLEMRAILKDEISAGLKGIEAELKKVASEGKAAGSGMSSGMSSALPSVRSVTDALGAQTAQLRAQAAAMKSAEYQKYAAEQKQIRAEIEAMTAPQKKAESGWMSMGTAVKGFMALQVVGYIKDATVAVFNATAEMQSLSMGLTAVMGSSAKATVEMEKLREVAKLPGLGYAEAIRMSTSLQASGMSAKMARDAMMGFGNALAAVGKGKAELDGVGLALSQIMSKGKVSAEEINQIAERVPQIRLAMQAAFGTASTEMLQAMGITSKEFISGVTAELGKLERVQGGLKTGTENLSDAWFEFKANLGGTGGLFEDILTAASKTLDFLNRKMAEGKQRQINEAMDGIAKIKELQKKAADSPTYAAWIGEDTRKEWDRQLAGYRGFLAKIKAVNDAKAADAKTDPEAERVAIVREAVARETKKTQAQEERGLKMLYEKRKNDAKSSAIALAEVEEWYQKRTAEIREEWAKKNKKKNQSEDIGWNDPKRVDAAKAYAEKLMNIEERRREKAAAAFNKQREDDLREEEKADKDHQKRVDDWNAYEEKKSERMRDFALEQEERRQKERDEFEADLASRLSMHNGTLTSMLKGETDFSDGMRTMWDETGTAVINKILEMGAAWIAEQAAMLVFGTTVKAAEVGTSVAAGTAMTAAYAPAATAASIASFGGAAAAGSASMAATIPAMMAMFSYADRGSSTLVGQNRLIVGESRPEEFRKTVPGNIHNTTTNMGGVTINLHSSNPAAAGRDIQRVLRNASINNYGGSH